MEPPSLVLVSLVSVTRRTRAVFLFDVLNLFLFLFRTRFVFCFLFFVFAGIFAVLFCFVYRIVGPVLAVKPRGTCWRCPSGGGLIMELRTIVHVARAI